MKVIVGSNNPVKIEAVEKAFLKYFKGIEIEGVEIWSGVCLQPFDEETFKGAKNRAENLKKKYKADYYVGIEGGIAEKKFVFTAFHIIDKKGKKGVSSSAYFKLPKNVCKKLLKGFELGDIIDTVAEKKNLKQKGGAVGYFSKGVVKRKDLYFQGVILALIPFINNKLKF